MSKEVKATEYKKNNIETTDHEIAYSPKGESVCKNQHKSGMMIIIK